MRRDDFRSVRNELISIVGKWRKEWSVGGGRGEGFIESVVKTGKRSDGEQWEEERDGASEQSEEVMTRDGHETSMAETETLAFRDRDETETRRSDFETRPRRDVCRSRDVTETLKCTFIVTNAVYYLNKLTLYASLLSL